MTRVIQQVPFANGNTLYICGWDEDNKILRYRDTFSGSQEISEEINIQDDKVCLSTSWFPIMFLAKFIEENKDDPTEEENL